MKKIIFVATLFLYSYIFADANLEKELELQKDRQGRAFNLIGREEIAAALVEDYIVRYLKFPKDVMDNSDIDKLLPRLFKTSDSGIFMGEGKIWANSMDINSNRLDMTYTMLDSARKNNPAVVNAYENNHYRSRTSISVEINSVSNKTKKNINILLKSDLAKHLHILLTVAGSIDENCTKSIEERNCIENNILYIRANGAAVEDSFTKAKIPKTYLLAYDMENFETGPIVIPELKNELTNKNSTTIFSIFKDGILIYDKKGDKYVKTSDGIRELNKIK